MGIDWADRFWSKVHPEALSGCWLWHGVLNEHGYGQYHHEGHTRKAHRVAFESIAGRRLAPSECLRHRCDVPACVNPDHLETGTQRDNVRDMMVRGRHNTWRGPKTYITHCPHGHEYTDANTYVYGGKRSCRECNRVRARANYRMAARKGGVT